jgi:general secretion pathway protein K
MGTAKEKKRKRGVALILALLFVVLLTVMVVEFSYESQVEASFAMNQASDFKAYLAAKSGIIQGVAILARDQLDGQLNGEPEYDSFLDPVPWYQGVPFRQLNGATMQAAIGDEYGKLNLNALFDYSQDVPVEREALVRALTEFFVLRDTGKGASPEAIVDAILDWLDYADDDEVRVEGAENDYYTSLEIPFNCRNGPMDSIEELLCIKGVTPIIYFGDPEMEQLPLSEYLTVHGDWFGRVNVNTARPEVIAALIAGYSDMPPDLLFGEDIAAEVLENPFMDVAAMAEYIGAMVPELQETDEAPLDQRGRDRRENPEEVNPEELPGDLASGLTGVQRLFMISSNVFRIQGGGMVEDVKVRIEAFVWRTPLQAMLAGGSGGGGLPSDIPEDMQNLLRNNDNIDLSQIAGLAGGDMATEFMPAEPYRILDWRVIR